MRRLAGYLGATLALLALWWLASLALRTPALPAPPAALASFVAELPALIPQAGTSLARIVMAMALGTGLALPLGLMIGRSRSLDALATPLLYLLYPIPKVVFLPVLLVLFGLGNAPKIILIGLVIFFQTLITARDAARNIAPEYLRVARSLGATKTQVARHVVVPATLPEVFTALRINAGTAIAILFLAESIAGASGLGYYIVEAWGMLNYAAMFAGIIAMALLGVVLYEALTLAERALIRWK
ncbi:MAG: ABC transporter permease subunit [Actinomycetes bacterium]|jgi:NitT/TauT family transport system permease protein|nr:ABC transporter permease subunit [Actinomycetes bacterium]